MSRAVRCALFSATALLLAAATVAPPLDRLADHSFTWHMVQHLALLYLVTLLALLARPFQLLSALVGPAFTARFVRATRPLHAAALPPVALSVFVATVWFTHFSGIYDASLENWRIHFGEHLLYLVAGTFFWLPVLWTPPLKPAAYPARMLYLAVALPQGALLAMAIGGAREPLYAHYLAAQGSVGAALRDQHDAAALMWIAGGMIVLSAFLLTLGAWARRETETANPYGAEAR